MNIKLRYSTYSMCPTAASKYKIFQPFWLPVLKIMKFIYIYHIYEMKYYFIIMKIKVTFF